MMSAHVSGVLCAATDDQHATMPKGVTASEWAYNRAHYLKPKAALLQAWSDMISKDLQSPEALRRSTIEVPGERG
ncbi:MAG: hypothetical protein DI547_06600 [Sphingobium sp.]|nr:MAG: hypothetical protein DI547_06600 [Sphingobium sp.]